MYAKMRAKQERLARERENRRLEQQLLKMQEEELKDRRQLCKQDELCTRTDDSYAAHQLDLLSSPHYKYVGPVNRTPSHQNTNINSKLSHYSPPVTRCTDLPPNAYIHLLIRILRPE